MDIGTAKPTKNDQKFVPHWGLDLVSPGERFTAHDFKVYANQKIAEIKNRQHIPVVVGGTGLYINALVYNFQLRSPYSSELRNALQAKSSEELTHILKLAELPFPENMQNKRHLIRIIETNGQEPERGHRLADAHIFGIWPEDDGLKRAIALRVEAMFEGGFEAEVSTLTKLYGKDFAGAGGIGYKDCLRYIEGELSLPETKELFARRDWQYARRQRTWFKRNEDIIWSSNSSECYNKVVQFLAQYYSN